MSSGNNSVNRQVALLRAQVFSVVNEANSSVSPERQVTYKSALTVVKRSLDTSRNKPFEVREFHAMRELSAFITLSQKNKSLSQAPRNTDLLPVGHPASTTSHAMTASAFINAQIQWALADNRISDEARPLLASLYTSEPESPEYKYALVRLGALPPGSAPLEALVASFGDGNSFAARRARAMLQRRDRKGRFAYQGGGIKALIKRISGVVENLTGKTVSSNADGSVVRIELPDGRLVDVPVDSGEFIKAIINPTPDGFSGIPAQYSAGDTIADEASLQSFDAPHGFTKDEAYSGDGVMYTDDSYDIIKRSDGTFDVSQRGAKGLGSADSWSESMKLVQDDEPNLIKAEGSKGQPIARLTPQQIDDMYDPEKNPLDVNPGGEGSKNKESAQKQLDDLKNSEILSITKNDDGSLRYENDRGDSNFALDLRATDDGKISVVRTEYTKEQDGYEESGESDLGNYDSIEAILEDDLFEEGVDLPQQFEDWKAQQAPEAAPEPVAELPETPEPSKKAEKFTKFEVPDGAIKLPLDPAGYDPEGRIDEESTDFTDDPAVLANKYDTKDLIDTLEAAIVPQDGAKNATGYGPLEFNQGEEFVPAEAIYAALDQQGEDAQMIVAKIYDKRLAIDGDTKDVYRDIKNEYALKASRAQAAEALLPQEEVIEEEVFGSIGEILKAFLDDVINIWNGKYKSGPSKSRIRDFAEQTGIPEEDIIKAVEDAGVEIAPNPESVVSADPTPEPDVAQEVLYEDAPPIEAVAPEPTNEPDVADLVDEVKGGIPTSSEIKAMLDGEEIGSQDDISGDAPSEVLPKALQEEKAVDVPAGTTAPGQLQEIPYETSKFVPNDPDNPDGPGRIEKSSGKAQVIDIAGRKVVIVDINGTPVPFYLSTGAGGKEDVEPGKWYPFFGVGEDGWINKGNAEDINNYYGSPELRAQAELLDATIGDIRANDSIPKVTPAGPHIDAINADLTPTENNKPDSKDNLQSNVDALVEKVKTTEAPEATPEAPLKTETSEIRFLDPEGDLQDQVAKAIEDGKQVRFFYSGSERIVTPIEVKYNEKNGNYNLVTEDAQGNVKTYTLSKIEGAPDKNTTPEPAALPEPVGAPQRVTTAVKDLQPGDVLANDYFVVESVFSDADAEAAKPGAVWVTGYYPGHASQKTKLWYPEDNREVFRFVEPPAKGDLPELSKPFAKNFGRVYKNQNGEWKLRSPEAQAEYDAAKAEYDKKLAEAMGRWTAPENAPALDAVVQGPNAPYKLVQNAQDLLPGDIAYQQEDPKFAAGLLPEPYTHYFVIQEVFTDENTPEGKVNVRGYYPGHESQVREWNKETPISIIRGDQVPAVGDKPALISPKQKDDKYEKDQNGRITPAGREAWLQDKAAFIEATKASAQNYNDVVGDYIAPDQPIALENAVPQAPRKPFKTVPAFQGDRLIEIVKAANGDPAKLKELLSQEEIIFFDYESTGDGNFKENADVIQLAAHRVKNGEIIDTFDVFINPGAPLGDWYYTTDENGNKVLKGSLKTADGQVVDDAFLANQISADEAHRQFAEWLGQDYILAGQNAGIFDAPILKYRLEQAGADYNPAGLIDTLPLARSVTGQKKGNGLEALAARYGINLENAHNANDDAKATSELLSALLDDMAQNKNGLDQLDPDAVADKAAQEMAAYEAAKKAYEDFQAGIVQAAVVDGGVNKDGSPITADQLIKEANANNVVDPEAFKAIPDGVKTEVPSLDSASWVNDDENTTLINEALRPTDLQLGDYIPTLDGGYRQIVDITEDPDNKDNFLVATRLVGTDEVIIASWFKYNKGFNGVRRQNDAPENPTPAAQASPVDQIVSDILDGKTTDVPSIDELIKTATSAPEADGGGGSDSSGNGGVVPAVPTPTPSEGGGPEQAPTPESGQVNNNVAANKRWQARFGRKPPVFYKKNRGMFYDINQVPVNVGDKVIHNNPGFAAKYGEGVVTKRIPNLQRKRVIGGRWVPVDYASYVYVDFGDGKGPRKFAARMLVNSDQDAVENPANEVKPVPDAEMGVPDVYIDNWKKFGKALEEFGVVPGNNLFGNDGFQAEAGNAQQVVITKDKDGNYAVYLKEENVRGYNRKVEPLFVSSNLPEAANFFVAEVHNRRYGVDLPPNPVWEGLEAPASPKTDVVDVPDAPAIDNSGKPSVVNIDPADDVQQQLQDAIDNGQKVAFFYNDKERLLDPINIWYNPKRDHFNLYAADPEGIKKNYTLDLIQKLDKPVEAPPIPEPLPLDKFEDFNNYVGDLVNDLEANPVNDYDIVKFGGDGVVFIQDKENKNQANIIWDEDAQGYKVSFNRSEIAKEVVFADIDEAGQYAIDNLEKERNKDIPEAPAAPDTRSNRLKELEEGVQAFEDTVENAEFGFVMRSYAEADMLLAFMDDLKNANQAMFSWSNAAQAWKVDYVLDKTDNSISEIPPKYFDDLREAVEEAIVGLNNLRDPSQKVPAIEPSNDSPPLPDGFVVPATPVAPEAPAAPSTDNVYIDPAGNAEQQIMDAIESGKKIVFNYNGRERVLTPLSVRKNPNNGNVNVYAEDADGERKNYTISKMEKVEKPAEQAPAVQDVEQVVGDEPAGTENLIAEAARVDAEAEKIRKRMEKYGFREQNDPEYIDLRNQLDDLVARRLLLNDQIYGVQNPEPDAPTPTPAAPLLPTIPDGERSVPVPRIKVEELPTPEDPQIAKDAEAAEKDLRKLRRELGPQNAARNYREQNFIANIQRALRNLNGGDLRKAKMYIENAKRGLAIAEQNNNPVLNEYLDKANRDRLEKMDVLFRDMEQGSTSTEIPFDGLPVQEFDPVEEVQKRIDAGENISPELSSYWRESLRAELLANNEPGTREFAQEIQEFFEGSPKPMAALSENARLALQSVVQTKLVDRSKSTEDNNNIKNLVELLDALHKERLAYEPNDGSKLDARGALLLGISLEEMSTAVRRNNGRLKKDGQDLGFLVKETGQGGGRRSTNVTYKVIDEKTGKVYYYKKDTDKENIDSELAALEVARALGMQGVYPAEAHPLRDDVVVMGASGQNQKLKKAPKRFGDSPAYESDVAENAPNQTFLMMVLDAVINNNDRHGMNWFVAEPQNNGLKYSNLEYLPLIYDNGLGAVIATGEVDMGYPLQNVVKYITKPTARVRNKEVHAALFRAIGQDAFYEMMQISTQQALQALVRAYPPGVDPNMDLLIARLEELKNTNKSVWS